MKSPESKIKKLSSIQYKVTQENGTEPPFDNPFWNHKEEGIYVDIISGEALFSSRDKFDSGSGWPCFTKPIEDGVLFKKVDHSFFKERNEVRSQKSDSHLGHLFHDGPPPDGSRYCINSAALRFVQKSNLEKEGYGSFLNYFEPTDSEDEDLN